MTTAVDNIIGLPVGRWVGMSYDGAVITGWGTLSRTAEEAEKVVQDLIDSGEP